MSTGDSGEQNPARVTLILARARNGVIGRDNQMPWKIPGEQAYFKRVTMGHPIIMGRKTWDSIGRPLPGRRSIVVTRDRGFKAPGAEVVHDVAQALAVCGNDDEVFVIGGAQIYDAFLARADRLMITEIDADFDGDTFFPAPDAALWRETRRDAHAATAERPFAFAFVEYERVGKLRR